MKQRPFFQWLCILIIVVIFLCYAPLISYAQPNNSAVVTLEITTYTFVDILAGENNTILLQPVVPVNGFPYTANSRGTAVVVVKGNSPMRLSTDSVLSLTHEDYQGLPNPPTQPVTASVAFSAGTPGSGVTYPTDCPNGKACLDYQPQDYGTSTQLWVEFKEVLTADDEAGTYSGEITINLEPRS